LAPESSFPIVADRPFDHADTLPEHRSRRSPRTDRATPARQPATMGNDDSGASAAALRAGAGDGDRRPPHEAEVHREDPRAAGEEVDPGSEAVQQELADRSQLSRRR